MEFEEHFMPYVKALESGIKEENWILAVMGACTLPDICTSLEGKKNRDYYIEWFNTYVKAYQHTLTRRKGFIAKTLEEWINRPRLKPEDIETFTHVFFSGVNAYALRCALLHNGNGVLASQPVQSGKGDNEKYKDQILDIENVVFKNDPRQMKDRVFHLFATVHSVTLYIYAFLNYQGIFPLKQEKIRNIM